MHVAKHFNVQTVLGRELKSVVNDYCKNVLVRCFSVSFTSAGLFIDNLGCIFFLINVRVRIFRVA